MNVSPDRRKFIQKSVHYNYFEIHNFTLCANVRRYSNTVSLFLCVKYDPATPWIRSWRSDHFFFGSAFIRFPRPNSCTHTSVYACSFWDSVAEYKSGWIFPTRRLKRWCQPSDTLFVFADLFPLLIFGEVMKRMKYEPYPFCLRQIIIEEKM